MRHLSRNPRWASRNAPNLSGASPGRAVVQHHLDHFSLEEVDLGGKVEVPVVVDCSAVFVEARPGLADAAVDLGGDVTDAADPTTKRYGV